MTPSPRPVSAVVTVPFAPEFQDLQDNRPLLTEVAALTGGRVLSDMPASLFDLSGVKIPETHMPLTRPLLILFLILFLLDVAVRRVALDLVTAWQDLRQWARRRNDVQDDPTLSRLRQRRQDLKQQLSSPQVKQVMAKRYEAPSESQVTPPPVATDSPTPKPPVAEPTSTEPSESEATSHIQQLLRAKRRGRPGPDDPSQGRPNP